MKKCDHGKEMNESCFNGDCEYRTAGKGNAIEEMLWENAKRIADCRANTVSRLTLEMVERLALDDALVRELCFELRFSDDERAETVISLAFNRAKKAAKK